MVLTTFFKEKPQNFFPAVIYLTYFYSYASLQRKLQSAVNRSFVLRILFVTSLFRPFVLFRKIKYILTQSP